MVVTFCLTEFHLAISLDSVSDNMRRSAFLRDLSLAISLVLSLYWYLTTYNWDRYQKQVVDERCSSPTDFAQTTVTKPATFPSPLAATNNRTLPVAISVQSYAYVFYATAPDYACSALVNIARLQSFHTPHRIIVLVSPSLSSTFLTAFTSRNVMVVPYEPPPHPSDNAPYYHDVLLKLVGFRLHHYIPSLSRVLILDADQLILQSLDHVFDLPPVDVAMPHAYWLSSGMTSAFILVSLSDRLWNRMEAELQDLDFEVFDMDLVNRMFSRTALSLPGDYCTLNSHWETNDIPAWYRGEEARDSVWEPLPFASPEAPLNTTLWANMTLEARESYERRIQQQREKHLEQQKIAEQKARNEVLLEKVYEDSKVLHFTAVGKPWQLTPDNIRAIRPNAHQLLEAQFATWWREASESCPEKTREMLR